MPSFSGYVDRTSRQASQQEKAIASEQKRGKSNGEKGVRNKYRAGF